MNMLVNPLIRNNLYIVVVLTNGHVQVELGDYT